MHNNKGLQVTIDCWIRDIEEAALSAEGLVKCLSERAVEVLPEGYCRGWVVVSLSAFVPFFRIRANWPYRQLKSPVVSFVVFEL